MSFLLSWPLWLSALFIYAVFTGVALALSIGASTWVRRWPQRQAAVGGLIGTIGSPMMAGFLFWMGLTAAVELRDIDDAERAVRSEVTALYTLNTLAASAAPAAAAGWSAQLADYGQKVLAREWPAMSWSGADADTGRQLGRLRGELLRRFAAEPSELRGALGQALQALSAARDSRLTVAAGHIPALVWRAMLICALIVLAFAALAHANQSRSSRWLLLLMGLFIGVQVHAVYVIDRPFVGAIAVDDAALRDAVRVFQDGAREPLNTAIPDAKDAKKTRKTRNEHHDFRWVLEYLNPFASFAFSSRPSRPAVASGPQSTAKPSAPALRCG